MKTTKIIGLVTALAILAAYEVSAATPSPQQVISNVRKAYTSLRSFQISGTVANTITADGKKESASAKYSLAFQKPAKLRLEAQDAKTKNFAICDGNNLYALIPGGKYYQKASLKGGLKGIVPLGGPGVNTLTLLAGVDFSKNAGKLKIVGQGKMSGVDTYILQFTLDKNGTAVQKLWVGKKDWLVRRNDLTVTRTLESKEKSGVKKVKVTQVSSTVVSSVKANSSIAASMFKFTPPKGVKLFDPKKAAEEQSKLAAEQKKKIEQLGNALEGKKAPAVAVKNVRGGEVKLSSLSGKPVILSFWISKHPASGPQLTTLQKIYSANRAKGLQIVAVSADPKPADAKSFADKNKVTFTIATVADQKSLEKIGNDYKIVGLPTTYVISRKGIIVDHFLGIPKQADLQAALKKAGL